MSAPQNWSGHPVLWSRVWPHQKNLRWPPSSSCFMGAGGVKVLQQGASLCSVERDLDLDRVDHGNAPSLSYGFSDKNLRWICCPWSHRLISYIQILPKKSSRANKWTFEIYTEDQDSERWQVNKSSSSSSGLSVWSHFVTTIYTQANAKAVCLNQMRWQRMGGGWPMWLSKTIMSQHCSVGLRARPRCQWLHLGLELYDQASHLAGRRNRLRWHDFWGIQIYLSSSVSGAVVYHPE